jgi:hypothetical protein
MNINFFKSPCKEPSRTDSLFGICDDQNGRKAYTDLINQYKWIATVINERLLDVTFTPIDHCITILKEGTKDQESTCDGMLIFQKSLYFVELKQKGVGGWLPEAISQLEITIKLLNANHHDLSEFIFKKAYACNKKHPYFTTIDNETCRKFFRISNGFRLDAQAEIVIK